jgi:hypothetical protein
MWGDGLGTITYAVTARHVIDGESKVYIDALDKHGKSCRISTKGNDWIYSEKTDLACHRISFGKYEVATIHIVRFLMPQECFREGEPRLQCGMDVYMVGLFVKSAFRKAPTGEIQVAPIVRFGKIALEETEATVYFSAADVGKPERAKLIRAMLIESISFEGESGSPVFSYLEHVKDVVPGSEEDLFYKEHHWLPRPVRLTDGQVHTPLVGMISSHWKVESRIRSRTRHNVVGDVGLNSGIAVVIPSEDIQEFLMHDPKVEKEREKVPKKPLNEPASPLSSRPRKPTMDQNFTKEDFEGALKKVSRKIEPEK